MGSSLAINIVSIIFCFLISKVFLDSRKFISIVLLKFFNNVPGYINFMVMDPEITTIVLACITRVQKDFASDSGRVKFNQVRARVLLACPDILDEAVDMIIQTIYDDFLKSQFKSLK